MLSGGKTGLASAPQKAQGTQMKEIWTLCVRVYMRWLWAHLHGLVRMCFHACVCLCATVCVHVGVGLLFQSACWQTVSWLMSSCRTSLFMSPVTHLLSQSTGTWNPETPGLSLALRQNRHTPQEHGLSNMSIHAFYSMTVMLTHVCDAQSISGACVFKRIQIQALWLKQSRFWFIQTAKFSISASLHFHLVLKQACIWDLTTNGCLMCPRGNRQRTGGFTKDLCFCCTVCGIVKENEIPAWRLFSMIVALY